ncbi:MAG: hypothetical protein JNK32_05490 [Anaerolineales bacterium]|nr:hypothetical protein [Anaerolineales bacterium]
MLAQLANKLQHSSLSRHLFFLFSTIFTILLIGYNFGTFDEAMHIPFLKATADPSLYPGDAMIALHRIYYSYFWYFFIPALRAGVLEPVLFVVHFISIYLTFWALWTLSQTLFHNAMASLFILVGFIVPHFGFSGFPVFEFAPVSRTFVLPFLLLAIDQFFRGKIPLAFLILGIMYNIHVVSVNFVLAMFGWACLMEFKRIGLRRILFGVALFLIAALPVLLWKSSGGDPIDFSLRPEWVDFLNRTLFLHLFDMVRLDYPGSWAITFGGLAAVALFFIALPATEDSNVKITAQNFMIAGLIVLLVHVISVYFLSVTILIQSQILRMGLWIIVLSYLFFANHLAKMIQSGSILPDNARLLGLVYIFSPSPVLVLAAWLLSRQIHRPRLVRASIWVAPLIIVGTYFTIWTMGFWMPGIYVYGNSSPWVDVQDWARENTDKNARFITPPEKWGAHESDWRVHSERASAGTLSEILVAAFQPGYELEWQSRFDVLAPGAFARFDGDYFLNVQFTREAYYSLSTEGLLKAACQLETQYIVVEKPYNHSLKVAYENGSYVVYDVSGKSCSH